MPFAIVAGIVAGIVKLWPTPAPLAVIEPIFIGELNEPAALLSSAVYVLAGAKAPSVRTVIFKALPLHKSVAEGTLLIFNLYTATFNTLVSTPQPDCFCSNTFTAAENELLTGVVN